MFRIGEFSRMGRTTVKTLRYYDEAGLLKPEETDPFTGYRLYAAAQLLLLHRIQSYRQIGLSIDEIRLLLAGCGAGALLRRRRDELRSSIEAEQDQLSRIEFILSGKEEEQSMSYQATIKELPRCIVYSKRMTVPSYESYFTLIPAIGEKVAARYPELKGAVPEYRFISYHDGEYKERDIDVEYCEAVGQLKEDFDDIRFKRIEAVTALSVMHRGGYQGLPQAYAYAFRWIEENGYTVAGTPRESYIDGVWNRVAEEDWLTEVQVPIAKK